MGKVQVLPPQLANMIAAGEVVGRPASVVKELMENSIDAGADNVHVVIVDAGRTLIQVIDNGSGMGMEDAVLCFQRHATSKISTPEDLDNIISFGFRGEALASIAAVATVCLKTRREEDELGSEVDTTPDGPPESKPCSTAKGTNISVRNLFYNTPARRKFLKADGVELKHIIEEFEHVALTRPEVAFSLNANGKDVFVLKKAKSLKFRIQDIFGANVAGNLVDLGVETSIVSISGFIGRPENARKTPGAQFFFVNGRYFRSPYLHKAVLNAYAQMIPEGVTPAYFIYLAVDPQSVDVNISPTKAEVKFENDSVIFQTVYACVREALGRNSFGAAIDFDTAGAVPMPQIGRSFEEYKGDEIRPSTDFNPDYNPFEDNIKPTSPFKETPHYPSMGKEDYSALFEQDIPKPTVQPIIIAGKYIATPVNSGLLLVNIRRAQIRILYERMLQALKENSFVSSTLLFPVEVNIGTEHIPIIEQKQELLSHLGFDIKQFGPDSVVVNGIPQGFDSSELSIRAMVGDVVKTLEEETGTLSELMQSRLAQRLSESEAASFSTPKNSIEAENLLEELFSCANSELTPSGKRTSCIVDTDEIDKKF